MFYHSLIQPYFRYCNIIYATNHTQPIQLIFRKKAIRIISLTTLRAHTKPLFVNQHILTLSNINKFQVCCFVYKVRNNLLRFSLTGLFKKEIHHHCTRVKLWVF